MATVATMATIEQVKAVAEASGVGRVWVHPSKPEVRVYQHDDYLTLVPTYEIVGGEERPAVEIRGRLSRGNGAAKEKLRKAGAALGVPTH